MAPAEVVWGDGAIKDFPDIVEDGQWRSVLLVRGRQSFEASGAAAMLPDLRQVARVETWNEFQPNPNAVDVARGVVTLSYTDPDLVIGVGGGSVMDMAKLLCAFDGAADANRVVASIHAGETVVERRRALVLAPTTSGTGSEATHFATVYVDQQKFSVAGPALYPDAIVLDPQLSVSSSPYQRASSGMDAVCQAIESLWATQATSTSRRFARRALRYLLPNIESFVSDPSPETARSMSRGSHLAGRAIDISRTTAAHALSYGITQRHGVSHGHAVALTLGAFIEAHASANPKTLQPGVDPVEHAEVMSEILVLLDAADGSEAREHLIDLIQRLGLASRLEQVGITTEVGRRELARTVDAQRLGNNPVVFDRTGLLGILERTS